MNERDWQLWLTRAIRRAPSGSAVLVGDKEKARRAKITAAQLGRLDVAILTPIEVAGGLGVAGFWFDETDGGPLKETP